MRRVTVRKSLAGLLASTLLVAPSFAADLEAFEGGWQRVERTSDDAARAREIDRATRELNVLIRGLARALMRRSMAPPSSYEIAASAAGFRVTAPDHESVEAAHRAHGCLVHEWQHSETSRGSTIWCLADGLLLVEEIIDDARVGDTLRYRTRYRRIPEERREGVHAAIAGPSDQ